jgi:hypothetical protein
MSQETELETSRCHPYWYTRVIKIFHVNVRYYGDKAPARRELKRMDVLFMCWFSRDLVSHVGGFAARRLHHIGFLDESDPDAFSFIDPSIVVRGVHLIPTFSLGRTGNWLRPLFVRLEEDQDKDWVGFYVNLYVPNLNPFSTDNKI